MNHCTEVAPNAVKNVDDCTIDEDTATIKDNILDCMALASTIAGHPQLGHGMQKGVDYLRHLMRPSSWPGSSPSSRPSSGSGYAPSTTPV